MKSETILFVNFLAYLLAFLFFLRKDHFKLGVKNIGHLWLALAALSSYMFYIQPGFEYTMHYSIMTITPFVYLFPCLMILYYPIRKIDTASIGPNIQKLPPKKLSSFMLISLPFLAFIFFAYASQAMSISIADMGDVREKLYDQNISNPYLTSWVAQTINRIVLYNIVLLYCLAFYCLVFITKKTWIEWCFILLPYGIGFAQAFATATRATILFQIMIIAFQYLLYQKCISSRGKKAFKVFFIILASLVGLLMVAMTVSRFGDSAGLFFYKYAGEAMINFNGIMFNHLKGTTDGMAYFWYLPQFLGLADSSFNSLASKWAFVENKTGVTGMIFYTIVGAFLIEFGKKWTLMIIALLSGLMYRLFSKKVSALMLIVLCWCTYNLIASVFLLPIQGDGGVFSVLGIFLFYRWMKEKSKIDS